MISEAIEGILSLIIEIIFRVIVEGFLYYTGEFILSVITLGRKKVRWNWYADESITKWMLLTDFSVIVGFFFWIFIFIIFKNI